MFLFLNESDQTYYYHKNNQILNKFYEKEFKKEIHEIKNTWEENLILKNLEKHVKTILTLDNKMDLL